MGQLINLFILIAIAAFIMIAWRYLQQRADEKLRNNPPPRRIIEVSLPVGVSDSAVNMARFYRKVSAAALGDKGARKVGARQVDFVYLVDVPAEGALPRMRCRIYADPDKMDAVKKALKSSFQEAVDVIELPEDDLLPVAKMLRPEEKEEEPENMEFAPEDIRALLEQGEEKEALDPDEWSVVEAEEADKEEADKEEMEIAVEEVEINKDQEEVFELESPALSEEHVDESIEEIIDIPVEEETVDIPVEGDIIDVPAEDVEIEDQFAPPKPQKSSGVQTIDFIISDEDEEEEPPKF